MQGAEFFLTSIDAELTSYFDDSVQAKLLPGYGSRVNYEWFFFATTEEKKRFDGTPLDFCGTVTDPVSKQRFIPLADSPTLSLDETLFVFVDQNTLKRFQTNPVQYKVPMFGM